MIRHSTLLAAAALVLATPLPLSAADYLIDSGKVHASINFRIQHLGFSWLTGRFDKFDGTFSYDENNPAAARVSVTIDTNSVNSNNPERDKHLRSADFLAVGSHPSASFTSTSVTPGADGTATITGDLTLHGVTKQVVIDAKLVGKGDDPWGGYRAGFSGTTKITLADFGIPGDLGPASREVYLDLNVEGIRQ